MTFESFGASLAMKKNALNCILLAMLMTGCGEHETSKLKTGASLISNCNDQVALPRLCGTKTYYKYYAETYQGSSKGYVNGCYFADETAALNYVRQECNKGSAYSATCYDESTWQRSSQPFTFSCPPPPPPPSEPWHPRDGGLWMNYAGTVLESSGKSYCVYNSEEHFNLPDHRATSEWERAYNRRGKYNLTNMTFTGPCKVSLPSGFFKVRDRQEIWYSNGSDAYCWVPDIKYVDRPVKIYNDNVTEYTSLRRDGACPR